MNVGKETLAFLDKVIHPPTVRDMRSLVDALILDDDIDNAMLKAGEMEDHFLKAETPGNIEEFYYWFGVTRTLRKVQDAKMLREAEARERRWQRFQKRQLAKIQHVPRKVGAP